MRLKADEDLSAEMVGLLRTRGFDVTTVHEEGLSGVPDDLVAHSARLAGRRESADCRATGLKRHTA